MPSFATTATRSGSRAAKRPWSSYAILPIQFSVFSHLFIEAQLRKCINAPDLAELPRRQRDPHERAGRRLYARRQRRRRHVPFNAGHFEWLAHFAAALGLEWHEIGKRRFGRPSTLAFCDALMEWYSSCDESTAAGASTRSRIGRRRGFWKELIAGLRTIKAERLPELPLGFWTFHDALEERHAEHTCDELREAFVKPGFSADRFLTAGEAMLDAVAGFWNGLDEKAVTSSD